MPPALIVSCTLVEVQLHWQLTPPGESFLLSQGSRRYWKQTFHQQLCCDESQWKEELSCWEEF